MTGLNRQLTSPDTADDYLPGHGDLSYDVTRYDLHLDYKLDGNRLNGRARIDAVAREELRSFTLDHQTLRATKVSISGASDVKYASHRGKLTVTPKSAIDAGQEFTVLVTYVGSPRPLSDKGGEAGWEELSDGVIVAGQPNGAPSWFPLQRPAQQQGRLPLHDHGTVGVLRGRQRRAAGAPARRQRDDLDLRPAGADGVVPRDGADRPLRNLVRSP